MLSLERESGLGPGHLRAASFGKFLRVAVNGKAPDVRSLVREFPPNARSIGAGLNWCVAWSVRLVVAAAGSLWSELQLGEQARFYPI